MVKKVPAHESDEIQMSGETVKLTTRVNTHAARHGPGGADPLSGISFDQLARLIQAGRASVSFPFAVTGEENVSASVTFPTAYPTGQIPAVVVSIEGIDVGVVNVSVTETGFTVTVRDDKGTDYTTSQTATVNWIAIGP